MAGNDRRHQSDRPRTGDQNVFGHQAVLRGGVDRVAERVENRCDVEVDLREVRPQVARGHDDVLGERAVTVDSDADGVGAQRPPAGQAVAAAAARDVAFRADDLAWVDRRHVFAELDDLTDELVADDQRRLDRVLRPLVPRVDVKVGAADSGAENTDQDLTRAGPGFGDVIEPQARRGFCFDERLH